uniref:Uncharacterized protein n=1 Tax=Chromera velia CCMP2878 TaxID=1169474 RepID=A0A0G4GK33_9ALVE|eukprot:Cvel_4813.t1-p1 / transcript=Cvel_4813.t1 / gene=Cvel_4813 / organism=Chromera_velia_CCMP2878 / gene_product=Choline transporter-like protein 2, putative / transcript_product=Choline transporter-like protein 2, putative / location=Cvel_scaffold216:36281-50006(+) / protein_length=1631 / sequence_SO=supercontig / SO=protein_coding / is_pseudo=false
MSSTEKEPKGEKFEKGGDLDVSNGPVKKRRCTDVIWCLLFLVHWAGVIVLAGVAFSRGNPERLIAGQDLDGNFCGVSGSDKSGYPFLYYTASVDSIRSSVSGATTELLNSGSVAGLSELSNSIVKSFSGNTYSVCTDYCPCFNVEGTDQTCSTGDNDKSVAALTRLYNTTDPTARFSALSSSVCPYGEKWCVPFQVPSVTVLDRFCFPALLNTDGTQKSYGDYVPSEVTGSWERWVGDVKVAWPMLPLAFGIALTLGLIFLVLIRCLAGALVWICLLLAVAMFAVGGYLLWWQAGMAEDGVSKQSMQIGAYVVWGLGGLFIIICLCMFRTIQLSIAIVKTAASFLQDVPSSLLVPLFFWVAFLALYAWWILVFLYIISSVDQQETADGKRFAWSRDVQYAFWYHFFSLLWNNCFLLGLSQLILAGAVGAWYFCPTEENGRKNPRKALEEQGGTGKRQPGMPVCTSMYRAFRYHLGSVALGSLILAIVKFIKWFLRYLAKQAQGTPGNRIMRCLIGCVMCLVQCFERCIEFLNKNAYIQVALTGKNFCISAMNAFRLIVTNVGRFSFLGIISGMLWFLGLVTIAGGTGVAGFYTTVAVYEGKVSAPWLIAVLMGLIGLMVGGVCMDVYRMAVDTTLQCFIADEELSGAGNSTHTPPALKGFLDKARFNNGKSGGGGGGGGEEVQPIPYDSFLDHLDRFGFRLPQTLLDQVVSILPGDAGKGGVASSAAPAEKEKEKPKKEAPKERVHRLTGLPLQPSDRRVDLFAWLEAHRNCALPREKRGQRGKAEEEALLIDEAVISRARVRLVRCLREEAEIQNFDLKSLLTETDVRGSGFATKRSFRAVIDKLNGARKARGDAALELQSEIDKAFGRAERVAYLEWFRLAFPLPAFEHTARRRVRQTTLASASRQQGGDIPNSQAKKRKGRPVDRDLVCISKKVDSCVESKKKEAFLKKGLTQKVPQRRGDTQTVALHSEEKGMCPSQTQPPCLTLWGDPPELLQQKETGNTHTAETQTNPQPPGTQKHATETVKNTEPPPPLSGNEPVAHTPAQETETTKKKEREGPQENNVTRTQDGQDPPVFPVALTQIVTDAECLSPPFGPHVHCQSRPLPRPFPKAGRQTPQSAQRIRSSHHPSLSRCGAPKVQHSVRGGKGRDCSRRHEREMPPSEKGRARAAKSPVESRQRTRKTPRPVTAGMRAWLPDVQRDHIEGLCESRQVNSAVQDDPQQHGGVPFRSLLLSTGERAGAEQPFQSTGGKDALQQPAVVSTELVQKGKEKGGKEKEQTDEGDLNWKHKKKAQEKVQQEKRGDPNSLLMVAGISAVLNATTPRGRQTPRSLHSRLGTQGCVEARLKEAAGALLTRGPGREGPCRSPLNPPQDLRVRPMTAPERQAEAPSHYPPVPFSGTTLGQPRPLPSEILAARRSTQQQQEDRERETAAAQLNNDLVLTPPDRHPMQNCLVVERGHDQESPRVPPVSGKRPPIISQWMREKGEEEKSGPRGGTLSHAVRENEQAEKALLEEARQKLQEALAMQQHSRCVHLEAAIRGSRGRLPSTHASPQIETDQPGLLGLYEENVSKTSADPGLHSPSPLFGLQAVPSAYDREGLPSQNPSPTLSERLARLKSRLQGLRGVEDLEQ